MNLPPGADKSLHIGAGLFLSALGMWWAPLVVLGFAAGVAKECLDKARGKPFDWEDAKATFAGAFIGSIVSVVTYLN